MNTNDAFSRKAFLRAAGTAGLTTLASGALPAADAQTPANATPALPITVLVRGGLPAESRAAIAALGPHVRLVVAGNDDEWRVALPVADAIFGGFRPDDLRLAKRLRWIQYGAAGVESVLTPEFVASPVVLTNGKGCYGPAIAEHVFGLLLGLTRNIVRQSRQMRERKWGGNGGLVELSGGKTMGIVGLGGIGRETARRAGALGLRVVACDIVAMQPEQVGNLAERIYLVDGGGLNRLLAESDIVVCAAPHTKRSEGMFGPAQFAAMKPGAYFINVSRGKLVQTPALVAALQSGKLAGAGLDVTDPEPLSPDSPLWAMENVIITSHTAGQSQFSQTRVQAVFVENVRRFALGLPLLNVVDKQAGY